MTHPKLTLGLVTNPKFHSLYLKNYSETKIKSLIKCKLLFLLSILIISLSKASEGK